MCFISDNNFTTSKDLTNTFRKELRNIINYMTCNNTQRREIKID